MKELLDSYKANKNDLPGYVDELLADKDGPGFSSEAQAIMALRGLFGSLATMLRDPSIVQFQDSDFVAELAKSARIVKPVPADQETELD